jgi:hypothetical protein
MNGRSVSERLITWTFAIASVAVAWQLRLPSLIGKVAANLGVAEHSLLHNAAVDVGTPIVLGTLAWGATQFYQTILWPFVSPDYKGGWWVYSLVAKVRGKMVDTVGCFYVEHRPVGASVLEGHAFHLVDGQRTYRGDWFADAVWVARDQLRIVYRMHAVNQVREPSPSLYEGYIDLRLAREEPLVGRSVWRGYFNDLGDRHSVSGPVYAEKLGRTKVRRVERLVEEALNRQTVPLIGKVRTKVAAQPRS